MTEFEQALSRLNNVRKISNGFMAECPVHHDIHQSLSIKETDGGKALIYCHAGCKYEDIIRQLGLTKYTPNEKPQIVATYDYTNASGELIYQVVRFRPKDFRQRKANGEWGLNGLKPLLYRLPEVIVAIEGGLTIFVVEGEKDVDTLWGCGQVATTLSGGVSSHWQPEHISYLHNATVAIIPDNDKTGKDYAVNLANLLYGWCSSLKILYLPVVVKGDVTDYLERHDIQSLLNILDNTPEYTPVGAVTRDEFLSLKHHLVYLQGKIEQKSKKVDKQYTIK